MMTDTEIKIEELKQEMPKDWQRSMRKQYLLGYYRKAFRTQYLRSKRYITDTILRCWYYMSMQDKALQRCDFEATYLIAEQIKECARVLKDYQDINYFRRQQKETKGMMTKDDIQRAKQYPIDKMVEFRRNMAQCVFHDDKTPSMQYYPDTNTIHCFGCHKSADSIEVYMHLNDVPFAAAVRALC